MERILQVVNSMDIGGTETVLMNLYKKIDRSRFQFDFVVHVSDECVYEPAIHELGGRIFRTEKYSVKNYVSYSRWWRKFLSTHDEYRIVHCHQGSAATVCLHEANRMNCISIAHSHGTHDPQMSLRSLLWDINSWPTRHVAKQFLACSEEAGLDRFGSRIVRSPQFHIMKNGIDIARFEFDPNVRKKMRAQLGLNEGCFAIGHVGRFSPQKNHAFLLHVLKAVLASRSDTMLLLVGRGNLEEQIHAQAEEMGILPHVRFLGTHSNVEDYYCAMDAFCFPSHWEGLGMVAVEAQTSGLPVVASEAVPPLADVGAGLFRQVNLNESAEAWAKALLAHANCIRNASSAQAAREAGYDITDVARWLQDYYQHLIQHSM